MTVRFSHSYGVIATTTSGQILKFIADPMCCGHRMIGNLRPNACDYATKVAAIQYCCEYIRKNDRQRCRVSVILPVGEGMDEFGKAFQEAGFRKSGKGTWNNSNTGHTLQSYVIDLGQ